MTDLLAFTIVGLVTGSAYAIAAGGLVLTYATSNVFNIAHGAIGMLMAFLYWEISTNQGLPTIVSLILVVGIAAPAFGYLIERGVMRRLTNAPVSVSLVVTVGLLVMLLGTAQLIWAPGARRVPSFFSGTGFQISSVFVTGHEITTFFVAAAVAGGLYYLLNRTRTGVAMRAVVDNRTLVALQGARPGRLSSLSWALGGALAALAGILLVPVVQLDYITLTLLVVNAYAAAMVGRLKNLPRTFVGAIILGLLQAYFLLALRYLPDGFDLGGMIGGLRAALPTIFMFVVMLLLPQEKLRVGTAKGTSLVPIPSRMQVLKWGAVFVVGLVVITGFLSAGNTSRLGQALALSLIMLSLVLLTGYGGEVSLAQMTFVGVGALVVAKFFGTVSLPAILAAGLVAAVVGALVALPALRLRGLYVALGTLAFAVAMDKMIFETATIGFSLGGSSLIERPSILGISLASERAFTLVIAVAFVVLGFLVLEFRRGRFGRLLLATRDSEAACGTLGLSIARTRVSIFAISAGMAGIGGALYGGMQVSVGPPDFAMFQSLPLLLLAVVFGITSVTGALLGGVVLGLLSVLPGGLVFLVIGTAAITLADNPNGLVSMAFRYGNRLRGRSPSSQSAPRGDVEAAEDPDALAGTAKAGEVGERVTLSGTS